MLQSDLVILFVWIDVEVPTPCGTHGLHKCPAGILDMGPDLEVNLLACEQKQLKHGRKMLALNGLYQSCRDTHGKIMQVWRDP